MRLYCTAMIRIKKEFNLEDEIVSGSMFTHNGEIVDERTKNIIEGSD